jgi:hypothetical protein
MKNTYVSQGELQKLQEEYTKLAEQAKPVESEEKKNKKLLEENKLLK